MSPHGLLRRRLLWGALTLPVTAWSSQATQPLVEVWKDPNCGCCQDWITHMEKHGFQVKAHNTGNTAVRQRLGMPTEFGSCHTALVQGYVLEGHVPAQAAWRLLKKRPRALGLAVPGMPLGSPGMDGPAYGHRTEPYQVLLVLKNGNTRVFQNHP